MNAIPGWFSFGAFMAIVTPSGKLVWSDTVDHGSISPARIERAALSAGRRTDVGHRPRRGLRSHAGQPVCVAVARADPTEGRGGFFAGGPGEPQRLFCECAPREPAAGAERPRPAAIWGSGTHLLQRRGWRRVALDAGDE